MKKLRWDYFIAWLATGVILTEAVMVFIWLGAKGSTREGLGVALLWLWPLTILSSALMGLLWELI